VCFATSVLVLSERRVFCCVYVVNTLVLRSHFHLSVCLFVCHEHELRVNGGVFAESLGFSDLSVEVC